tara:strand:+ start:1843 stop:2250 length:408 start_codon:yes stop_codon:yes gene_type:complete
MGEKGAKTSKTANFPFDETGPLAKKDQNMITLTEKASTKVAELLAGEDDENLKALRVGVRPGGCAGLNYEMYFESEITDDDTEQLFGEVKVVADSVSAGLLEGASLDYYDGLGESGFKISNNKAKKTCGCGQSFC